MKAITFYIIIASLLFSIGRNGFYYAYFLLNQSEIVQKYCINKEKPELKCSGSCHLKAQLQADEQNGLPAFLSEIDSFSWIFVNFVQYNFALTFSESAWRKLYFLYKFKPETLIYQPPITEA